MNIQTALEQIINGHHLNHGDMQTLMRSIMQGHVTPAQLGGLLVALRLKGEQVAEITAAAEVMRELANQVIIDDDAHLIDTCGTGGDMSHTFNISTTVAFVAAACGAKVAKHGNRSISSQSGSADVLAAAGINLHLDAAQVAACIEEVGVGFMFAPAYHRSMQHVAIPRRELGIRTLFNLLGPLTNPANAPCQLLGVFSRVWLQPLAEVLKQLGSRHTLVVHSEDGLDEISIAAKTFIVELKDARLQHYQISPDDFGFKQQAMDQLAVNNIDESLKLMQAVFDNEPGAATDIVCLNAGAAIYVAGLAASIEQGVELAKNAIEQGAAKQKFEQLIDYSQSFN